MKLLKCALLLPLSLSSLSSFASISFNCKKTDDRKLQHQSTKSQTIVMTCRVDQYKLTKNGYQLPTYLQCKNGAGDFYLYQLVPDHSTSTKETDNVPEKGLPDSSDPK